MRAAAILLVFGWAAAAQTVPTTQPIDDLPYFRELEAGGTIVLVQQRHNPAFLSTRDAWYQATWQDTFIWRPGYAVVPIYGWECRYVTDDGRWLVLHRHGAQPRIQSVQQLLANARQVTFLQADVTRDGKVDQADFGILQAQLGRAGPLVGDLNRDGYVDGADVELFDLVRSQMGR